MRSIRVIFDDGDIVETNINGTNEEITNYYIGQKFVKADETTMHTPVKVEFLDEDAVPNRTQCLLRAFGCQGGTIHQLADWTGCSVQQLLYETEVTGTQKSYQNGWLALKNYTFPFLLLQIFPKYKGNLMFWLGIEAHVRCQ